MRLGTKYLSTLSLHYHIFTKRSDTQLSEMKQVKVLMVLLGVNQASAPSQMKRSFFMFENKIFSNYFTVFPRSTANFSQSTKDDCFGGFLFLFLFLQIRLQFGLVKCILKLQWDIVGDVSLLLTQVT